MEPRRPGYRVLRIALLAIGLCVTSPAKASPEDDAALNAIAAVDDYWRKLAALEPVVLEHAARRAHREGKVLKLFPDSGAPILLKDDDTKCDDPGWSEETCRTFLFGGYFPSRRVFLVFVGYFEGWDWLLIDAGSGRETKLRSPPLFEPGGDRFVMIDDSDAYGIPGIQIWRRSNGTATIEWDYVIDHNSPHKTRLLRWAEDRIEFEFFIGQYQGQEEQRWPAVVRQVLGAWVLEAIRPEAQR